MPEPLPDQEQTEPLDLRLYIGMIFFRWKVIVVCFLYALLGGVLYIDFTPPQYVATCAISIYRDPLTTVTKAGGQWANPGMHAQLLSSEELRDPVVSGLFDRWGEQMGGRAQMNLPVTVRPGRSTVNASVKCVNRDYAVAFLDALLKAHEAQWESKQRQSMSQSMRVLEDELALTEEKVKAAQNDIIEYTRLNDLTRQAIRKSIEDGFIKGIMGKRTALETELFMMETANPELKDSNLAVISAVENLTGGLIAASSGEGGASAGQGVDSDAEWLADVFDEETDRTARRSGDRTTPPSTEETTGFVSLRIELLRLKDDKAEAEKNFTSEHPRLQAIEENIKRVQGQLERSAQLKLMQLQDKYRSMLILLKSLESMEYKWQAKQLQAMVKETELTRFRDRLSRYKENYSTLYTRYHEMRIAEETKTERFSISQPAMAGLKPTWPDATRVLLIAIVVGLGSGFGVAFGLQFLDNKIQSIKDVEKDLRIHFLGGIPFWVHSGLERTIRPIVTEEHSTGAIEAYRALRTVLTTELAKQNEKIMFITSADSREGKTLTTLNLAIMTAQMNKKVLLVDMDLRRGRLHRSLGVEKSPGVTDALKEGRSFRDVVKPTRIENLSLAPTGRSSDGSAELLQSVDLMAMLVELQDDFDYIFIDTSPILRVTDTVILTTLGIGVVVYVARVNHTPKPLIRYSLDMLKEANVLGLIMNSIEMHKISSLYYAYQYPNYAYYSNAYAYGYNYYHYGEQKGKAQKFRRKSPLKDAAGSIQHWIRSTFFPMD